MINKNTYDNTHLTLDERKIIQTGIGNRCKKVDIARIIVTHPKIPLQLLKK